MRTIEFLSWVVENTVRCFSFPGERRYKWDPNKRLPSEHFISAHWTVVNVSRNASGAIRWILLTDQHAHKHHGWPVPKEIPAIPLDDSEYPLDIQKTLHAIVFRSVWN